MVVRCFFLHSPHLTLIFYTAIKGTDSLDAQIRHLCETHFEMAEKTCSSSAVGRSFLDWLHAARQSNQPVMLRPASLPSNIQQVWPFLIELPFLAKPSLLHSVVWTLGASMFARIPPSYRCGGSSENPSRFDGSNWTWCQLFPVGWGICKLYWSIELSNMLSRLKTLYFQKQIICAIVRRPGGFLDFS